MLKKLQINVSFLFSLLLLILSVWAIAAQLHEYNYRDLLKSLATIPKGRLSWSIWLSALGYLVMIPYDILGFSYVGCSLNWQKIAFTNFISSVFGNTIGFALLTGSAVRYRFYACWGVSALTIAQVIAFANFTFWLGLFTVAGLMFLSNPLSIPQQLHLPLTTVRPIGVIFLLLVGAYVLGCLLIKGQFTIGYRQLHLPNLRIALLQILISSLDWILAAAVLYTLLPMSLDLSYPEFLGIYLLSMFAGVVSNIPGGLGVFETVIILLLSTKVSSGAILGSLLAYRGVYYLLPLLVALGLLGGYEMRYRRS